MADKELTGFQKGFYNDQPGFYNGQTKEFIPKNLLQKGFYNGKKAWHNPEIGYILEPEMGGQIPLSPSHKVGDYSGEIEQRSPIKQTISNIARPVLQAGGMVGGGLLGSGAAPIAGTIAGAGLGYAAGEQAANKLDELMGLRQPKSVYSELAQAGKDIGTGALYEMGGQAAGKTITAVAPYMQKAARNIYGRALKPSTTLTAKARDKVITSALEENIGTSSSGLNKSFKKVEVWNNKVKDLINQYTQQGTTIPKSGVTSKLDDLAMDEFSRSIDPVDIMKESTALKDIIETTRPKNIPVEQAQTFKTDLNAKLGDFYKKISQGKQVRTDEWAKARAAVRDGLAEEIEKAVPGIHDLNAKMGGQIGLQKELSRAVNRINNRQLLGLVRSVLAGTGASVGGVGGALKGILIDTILNRPQFTSKVAIGLYKASKMNPETSALAFKMIGIGSENESQGGE